MASKQIVFALIVAVSLFIIILELVRRRKLKEKYSWLWLVTGIMIMALVLKYEFLVWLTDFVGAFSPMSTLFFFALLFVILLCIQFSVSISGLQDKIKNLAQELAIIKTKLKGK